MRHFLETLGKGAPSSWESLNRNQLGDPKRVAHARQEVMLIEDNIVDGGEVFLQQDGGKILNSAVRSVMGEAVDGPHPLYVATYDCEDHVKDSTFLKNLLVDKAIPPLVEKGWKIRGCISDTTAVELK